MHPNQYNLIKAAYSIVEVGQLVPFSRTTIYRAMQSGQLKATKLGTRTMILAPHLAEFLDRLDKPATTA